MKRGRFSPHLLVMAAATLIAVYIAVPAVAEPAPTPAVTTPTAPSQPDPSVQPPGTEQPTTQTPAPLPFQESPAVRGIYVRADVAGDTDRFPQLLRLLDRTELNAVVVDVKTDWGNVSFAADDPEIQAVGATQRYIPDIHAFLETLRAHRVYRIARIVTFKDQPATSAHPDWAVADVDGGAWQDSNGMQWLDPYNRQAWAYIVAVARAAARAGFDEIQFDYVRFPTDGDVSRIIYPSKDGRSQQQVIGDFLAYARRELHPEGVKVSADVFGLVTSFADDMGIGQHLEHVAAGVDYVSPMLYPSHYTRGNLGIANPEASPYDTVLRSLRDARGRIDAAGLTGTVEMRPWLQDFSWRYDYGPAEVRAQIDATYDAGYREWLLWNAANEYTASALKATMPAADDPFVLGSAEVGGSVTVLLNGQPLVTAPQDAQPVLAKATGRTLVPLRMLSEALGATVDWDNETRVATIAYRGHQVAVPIGARVATVDGEAVRLDQPALTWQQRTMVPLRFLAEALGVTVEWDPAKQQVNVSTTRE